MSATLSFTPLPDALVELRLARPSRDSVAARRHGARARRKIGLSRCWLWPSGRGAPAEQELPAVAATSRKSAAVVVASAANVTATPARSTMQPANIAVGGLEVRNRTAAAAPIPLIER